LPPRYHPLPGLFPTLSAERAPSCSCLRASSLEQRTVPRQCCCCCCCYCTVVGRVVGVVWRQEACSIPATTTHLQRKTTKRLSPRRFCPAPGASARLLGEPTAHLHHSSRPLLKRGNTPPPHHHCFAPAWWRAFEPLLTPPRFWPPPCIHVHDYLCIHILGDLASFKGVSRRTKWCKSEREVNNR